MFRFKKHWRELRRMFLFLLWFIITFIILFLQLDIHKSYLETAPKEFIKSSEYALDLSRILGDAFITQRYS
jgi:hypothetical protein